MKTTGPREVLQNRRLRTNEEDIGTQETPANTRTPVDRVDAVDILNWLNTRRVRTAVMVGAGPIGMEIAYLAARHGIRIHVIEMLEHILPRALDPDMSAEVESYMQSHNVELQLGQRLEGIRGNGEIEGVVLSSGGQIETQMVLISVGVKPNTELAEQAGLKIGKHGLAVNKY